METFGLLNEATRERLYALIDQLADDSARIVALEATLEEILGEGCCDDVRPKTLERWRATLRGSRP